MSPVSRVTHNATLEIIFTVVPAFIVFMIAMPSFALLYSNNDWLGNETELTVHITGHQWYWNYEYSVDKLYFKDIESWEEFFIKYYAFSDYTALGETSPAPRLLSNTRFSEELKELFSDYVLQKDTLFIYLDSADDFDSYMVKMEDIIDNFTLEDSNSVFDDSVKDAYAEDKFNFAINIFSYSKFELLGLDDNEVAEEDRYGVVKTAAAYAYGDFFVGDLIRLNMLNYATAIDLISRDVFEDNFFYSAFNCDEVDLLSNIDHIYTIGGLNSFFESNPVIVDYFTSGWIELFDFDPLSEGAELLTMLWRHNKNTFDFIYIKEFSSILKRVFYEGYFDSNVPLQSVEDNIDAMCFIKVYPSVFDSTSIFYLVTGKTNSYFATHPSARYHPTDAALFWYKGRTFNNYLEVDNSLILPYGTNIKLSITADDVIHS